MPYDRRLGDLRERANRLLHEIRANEEQVRNLPLHIQRYRETTDRMERDLAESRAYIARERPRLEQLEQEIRRLEGPTTLRDIMAAPLGLPFVSPESSLGRVFPAARTPDRPSYDVSSGDISRRRRRP